MNILFRYGYEIEGPTRTLKKECHDLGINIRIDDNVPGLAYMVIFDSPEDLNLYRLTGTIKETPRVRFTGTRL